MRHAPRRSPERVARVLTTTGLLLAGMALARVSTAQMVPIADERRLQVGADFLGVVDADTQYPGASFGYWNGSAWVHIDNPDPEGSGFCESDAWQLSQFGSSYISASGGCGGSWQLYPGSYVAVCKAKFRFRVDACVQYQLDAWLEPGDDPAGDFVRLRAEPGGLVLYEVTSGELHVTGRLAPGEYSLEGFSSVATSNETATGSTFTYLWTAVPCYSPPPIIDGQPTDVVITAGYDTTFTVSTSAPAPTYQWRRNLVPLANNGHFSGVGGPTLTVNQASAADTGYFDVLVTSGGVTEPSRLAHLSLVPGNTAVGDGPMATPRLALEITGPNPFTRATSFRYSLPRPQRLRVSIEDATGARVRTLLDGVVGGTGSVSWDGTSAEGVRARAGVYFLHAESGGETVSRKIVLMR